MVPSSKSPLTPAEYMVDNRTHLFWWTWIPALPLSRDDRWYRVLRQVFADHTTNCLRETRWDGFYTEGQENHQVVSVFHTFSAFPTLHWTEALLRSCSIDFVQPVTAVRWQYQLQGKVDGRDAHADIALRITDGSRSELAVVLEAKRKRGRFNTKDNDPDYYTRLNRLDGFSRKHAVYLIDESDLMQRSAKLPGCRMLTWQTVVKIQMYELERLALVDDTKSHLLRLVHYYLQAQGIFDESPNANLEVQGLSEACLADVHDPRVAALIRGAEVAVAARQRHSIRLPANWLSGENTIREFAEIKVLSDWTPVW